MKTTCVLSFLVVVLAISFTEAIFCPSAGFYADPASCEGFTMCYDDPTGVVGVSMKCPPGMAFDREGGYCSRVAMRKYC